jgi:hypothetical protein
VGAACLGAGLLAGLVFLLVPGWAAALLGLIGMAASVLVPPWLMVNQSLLVPSVALTCFWPGLWLVRAAAKTWMIPGASR